MKCKQRMEKKQVKREDLQKLQIRRIMMTMMNTLIFKGLSQMMRHKIPMEKKDNIETLEVTWFQLHRSRSSMQKNYTSLLIKRGISKE